MQLIETHIGEQLFKKNKTFPLGQKDGSHDNVI